MARLREFDEPAALRAMVKAFWAQGYQATSIRNLEEATGLTTGSLYKAYGSKTEIFNRCVEYYMENQSYLAILKRHDDLPLAEALRAVMDAVIDSVESKGGRAPGCLVTNLAAELALVEPELGQEAARRLKEVQHAIKQRLLRAQASSQLNSRQDVETLSAFLMTVLQGMLVISTSTKDIAAMRRTRDFLLAIVQEK